MSFGAGRVTTAAVAFALVAGCSAQGSPAEPRVAAQRHLGRGGGELHHPRHPGQDPGQQPVLRRSPRGPVGSTRRSARSVLGISRTGNNRPTCGNHLVLLLGAVELGFLCADRGRDGLSAGVAEARPDHEFAQNCVESQACAGAFGVCRSWVSPRFVVGAARQERAPFQVTKGLQQLAEVVGMRSAQVPDPVADRQQLVHSPLPDWTSELRSHGRTRSHESGGTEKWIRPGHSMCRGIACIKTPRRPRYTRCVRMAVRSGPRTK
jgi:hypothetical protein